jgi:putative addiction module component (TIGR02574 family)
MDKSALLDAMEEWSVEEQLEFIDAAYERLANAGALPVTDPEVWAEIERRLAEHEKDPNTVLTWEEVEARLKAKK